MLKKETETRLAKAGDRFDKFSSSGSLLHSITASKSGADKVDSYESEIASYDRKSILRRVGRESRSDTTSSKR